jgi:hypothetical protein
LTKLPGEATKGVGYRTEVSQASTAISDGAKSELVDEPLKKRVESGNRAGTGDPQSAPGRAEEFGEECGGEGGVPYQVFAYQPSRLTRVTVWHRDCVDGIQLETETGVLPRIGGTGQHRDVRQESFELASDEFLTGISVEYWKYINRLTFHSNQRSYGPYGGTGGQVKKRLNAPEGRIVTGFKGRHWELIDSIQLMIY